MIRPRVNSFPDLDEAAPDPASPQQSTSRRLTVLYIFALSTVAVLSIGAQWLIQQQLSNGESDSRVINVAGRQRMLSQRLAKASLQIANKVAATGEQARSELSETLETWADNHRALQDGDATTGLPGNNSEEVRRLFASIEEDFNAMRTAAARLLREPSKSDLQDVATIQSHEGPFLQGMDRIVSQLVTEAEQRVARLRTLEWAILALTLIVLLAEGLLIFRPAATHIQQTFARLSALTENLRRSRDEAEEANAAKTRFLANVSHELRTPMTAVLGMTELAQRAESTEERLRYLGIVEEAGETLLGLLNDLIDLSQIDANALELRNEPFSPFESVRRVVRMLEPACQAKDLLLRPDLTGEDFTLLGDARRLEQVLVNLVANAIKWTDDGEIAVSCRLEPSDEHIDVKLEVRDTGIGIPESDQQRIFQPFTQSDQEGASRGGVGLGLAICQQLTTAMGGRIHLASEVGLGTTVTLRMPLPIAIETLPSSAAVETHGKGEQPYSILIVEDAEVNQLLLRKLLEQDGRRVVVCSTGEEALERFRDSFFEVALIDYQLPGIDGIETARGLHAIAASSAKRPRLLCVSAHAGLPDSSIPGGLFDAFLTKPIRGAELLAAVQLTVSAPGEDNGSTNTDSYEQELAATFLGVYEDQSNQLRSAAQSGDWSTVALLAHRFKGQVGYFHAETLIERLDRLEKACRSGRNERLPHDAQQALAELDALRSKLKANPR